MRGGDLNGDRAGWAFAHRCVGTGEAGCRVPELPEPLTAD